MGISVCPDETFIKKRKGKRNDDSSSGVDVAVQQKRKLQTLSSIQREREREGNTSEEVFSLQLQFLPTELILVLLISMSFSGPSIGSVPFSGAKAARKAYEFGRTYVVRPKGKHQATVVWLHGLGDNGGSWSQILETLPLPNIKWICPTAPARPVSLFGGFPSTAWFDVANLSEDSPDDVEGLDASAAHVVNLLSSEPTGVKYAVGGFSMGAALALHAATCYVAGKYANGDQFPTNLSAAVGLSGWLPCSKGLSNKLAADEAANRAVSLPILLCHGKVDDVVQYKYGKKSSEVLASSGFRDVTFKSYNGLGHYTHPEEVQDICKWLKSKLNLDGH